MSGLSPMAGGRNRAGLPTPPQGEPIAAYATYAQAQRAVDHLSDEHFPVENITVVGEGLQLVERVTGRLTYPRAAGAGALSGAWFGLFIGLLLSIFGGGGTGFGFVIAAVILGIAFGVLFGVISYALTGGRRDFTSFSQMVARRYVVLCRGGDSGRAYWLLQRLSDNPPLPEADSSTPAPVARPHDPQQHGSPQDDAPQQGSFAPDGLETADPRSRGSSALGQPSREDVTWSDPDRRS